MVRLFLGALILCELLLGLMFGTARLSLVQIGHALSQGPASHDVIARIIWHIRFPRCIIAALAGACFAQGGALLQIVTRNDLADPYLFGLSSGAAAGAVAAIVFLGDFAGIWTPFLGAGAGALSATLLLIVLLLRGNYLKKSTAVLGGVAISFFFASLTNIFIFFGDRNSAQSVMFWTMGSFSSAQWSFLPLSALGVLVMSAFWCLYRKSLQALRAGEDTARSLGVHTHALRRGAIVCCALGCGLNVCVCGPVPFVGLVVPHIARFLGRSAVGMGSIACIGASLTLGADIISRCILPAQEMPVGVLISAFGSIFLAMFLMRSERF